MPAENTMVLYRHTATQLVPQEFTAPFPSSVFWDMENNNLYIKQNKSHRLGKEIINKVFWYNITTLSTLISKLTSC